MKALKNKMILGKDAYFDLDTNKTLRNNNVMIVGSPGSGKTRGVVIPNLLMAHGSYVVSDPKGNLCDTYGPYLKSKGYTVKRLDFSDPSRSMHYNPLHYVKSEQDILKLATVLATTTDYGSYGHTDPIWPNTAIILLSALIGYAKERLNESDTNLHTVFEILGLSDASSDARDSGHLGMMDKLFLSYEEELKKAGKKDSFAVRQYKKVASGSGKTFRSIVISVLSGMGKFDTEEMAEVTAFDEINICDIAKKKTVLFVCVSDTDRSMDVMANVFFMQALNELCNYADRECAGNHLPIPVRFIMDDFATNCKVDQFPRMIAAFRSRWISAILILQAESQLNAAYGDDGRTIIGSCDTYVYLGGNDIDTAKAVSERCDEPLLSVLNMPVGESIIFRRGEKAFHTTGFPLEEMEEYQVAMDVYDRIYCAKDKEIDNTKTQTCPASLYDRIEQIKAKEARINAEIDFAMHELSMEEDFCKTHDADTRANTVQKRKTS